MWTSEWAWPRVWNPDWGLLELGVWAFGTWESGGQDLRTQDPREGSLTRFGYKESLALKAGASPHMSVKVTGPGVEIANVGTVEDGAWMPG